MAVVIKGRVHLMGEPGEAAQAMPRLLVQAWDTIFLRQQEMLGEAVTDSVGGFMIEIDPTTRSGKSLSAKTKIYYRVRHNGREIPVRDVTGSWAVAADDPKGQPTVYETALSVLARDLQTQDSDVILKEVAGSLRDLVAIQPTKGGNGTGSQSYPSEIETAVADAARDLLGKRVAARDGKGLISALSRVFEFEVVDGHRSARWRPPTYAVETELGAQLTGAQASLYQFAATGIAELRRRIDTLVAQGTDVDDDRVSGARLSFLAEVDDLLGALGSESLRSIRIDGSFERLEAYLEEIEEAFDFDDDENRLTVEDERAYTDFLIAEQYLNGLKDAWVRFRDDPDVTFGTLLMELERLFAVVTEGVDEIYTMLDTLDFDAAERRATELTFSDEQISIAELFDWVLIFSSKAARVLKDGGRKALPRLCSEATQLYEFMDNLVTSPPTNIRVFNHSRVIIAIAELAGYLEQVKNKLCFDTYSAAGL
ncbi:MAG: hypothetical protein IPK17_34245 [Chloroflexi bacterium]|uniref:hypothetical protein n=1 Tax=Candidatus Flexifilum breve TaxID=3140694 RepID=UPI0031353638|nr:hypothetical protein [Chloroflexota bacterium]